MRFCTISSSAVGRRSSCAHPLSLSCSVSKKWLILLLPYQRYSHMNSNIMISFESRILAVILSGCMTADGHRRVIPPARNMYSWESINKFVRPRSFYPNAPNAKHLMQECCQVEYNPHIMHSYPERFASREAKGRIDPNCALSSWQQDHKHHNIVISDNFKLIIRICRNGRWGTHPYGK